MPSNGRTLYTIFGVTLMGVIGVSILSPAFPEIRTVFNISDSEVALLISVFTFPGIFFAPAMGILADRFGRRNVLVPSLILFAVTGVSCVFVDFQTMLILRFFQGIGGSALVALSAALIGDIYEGIERTEAIGYNASVLSIGIVSYLVLGGILAHYSWKLPFFTFSLAIPVALAVLFIESPGIKSREPIGKYFINSAKLLKNREILVQFISSMAVFIMLYGAFLLYFPLLLGRYDVDPIITGILLSSMNAFTAIFSSRLKFFVRKVGISRTIQLGFGCYSIGLLTIPVFPLELFIISTLIFGIGHGIVIPSLQNLVVSTAPDEYRAVVMGTYGSILRTGQTIGPVMAAGIATFSSPNMVFFMYAGIGAFFSIFYMFYKPKFDNDAKKQDYPAK